MSCTSFYEFRHDICGDSTHQIIEEKDDIDVYRKQHHNTAVIVLHGMHQASENMSTLVRSLKKLNKYAVLSIDYPVKSLGLYGLVRSALKEIKMHIEYINNGRDEKDQIHTVHLVGYSLGGIVALNIMTDQSSKLAAHGIKIDKLVQIGTPNCGTKVANMMHALSPELAKEIAGPMVSELRQEYRTAICKNMNVSHYTVGSIAGNSDIGYHAQELAYMFSLPTATDGRVPVSSTRIRGMKDHIVLPYNHCQLKNSQIVSMQVACFLDKGKFCHRKKRSKISQ